MNTQTPAAYVLWDTFDKKHEIIAAKGTYEECQQAAIDRWGNPDMIDMVICANVIIESWDNPITRTQMDRYSDGTCVSRPLTV